MRNVKKFNASSMSGRLSAGISALAMFACSQAAFAQNADSAADESVAAGEIIVTATKREQSLKNVPLSVQAIAATTMSERVIVDTSSLVALSPSVNYQSGSSSNAGGFIIRGVSSQSAEGGFQQSTAMIIDGVAVAKPGEYLGDLGDIERVEILRGPQGTLFGKNATAGLINIVTKRPTQNFEGYIQAGATNDEEYSFKGMLNVPLGDNVAARVTGFYKHLKPLFENLGPGNETGGYEQLGVQAKLLATFSDSAQLLVMGEYRKADSTFLQLFPLAVNSNPYIATRQIQVLGFTPEFGNHTNNTNGIAFDTTEGYSVSANLTIDISDTLTFTSISAYRHYFVDAALDTDATPIGCQQGIGCTPNPFGYPVYFPTKTAPRYPQTAKYFSQEARLNFKTDNVDLIVGGYFQGLRENGNNTVPSIRNGPFGAEGSNTSLNYSDTTTRFSTKDDFVSIFGDVTFKFSEQFSVFAGLRYNHEKLELDFGKAVYSGVVGTLVNGVTTYNSFFNPVTLETTLIPTSTVAFNTSRSVNNLSGRAGLQWQPTPDTNIYASYNRGYKGGAVDVSRGAAAPTATYSPILEPEIATSYEAGIKQTLLDRALQINFNIYSQKINGLQQAVIVPGTTSSQYFNTGAVASKGFELEISANASDNFQVNAGLVYTDAKYEGDVFIGCYTGQTGAQGCGYSAAGTLANPAALSDPARPAGARFYNLNGLQARGSQKWRWNLGATYSPDLISGIKTVLHVDLNYFDKTPQNPGNDPFTIEKSHIMLDAALTIADEADHWQVQIYGKNLTNELSYLNRSVADNSIGRVAGWLGRDYKRYGGVRFTYNFR